MNQSRRRFTLALLGAGSAALLAGVSTPADAAPKRKVRRFVLNPTGQGVDMALYGKVTTDVRPAQARESIKIEIQSINLSPGAEFDVYAIHPTNQPEGVFLGVVTLSKVSGARRVRGVLNLATGAIPPIPEDASPVAGITRFVVTPHDNPDRIVLATGNFGGGIQPLLRKLELTPTQLGLQTDTTGRVETETSVLGRQRLRVRILSEGLPVGEQVQVRYSTVNNGTITTGPFALVDEGDEGDDAILVLDYDNFGGVPLPVGTQPVNGITSVSVIQVSSGQPILIGTF